MRLSSRQADRTDDDPWSFRHFVTIDGKTPPPFIVVADEELGELVVVEVDGAGNPIFDEDTGDFKTKSIFGVVRIHRIYSADEANQIMRGAR